jgi:hypothetical protein
MPSPRTRSIAIAATVVLLAAIAAHLALQLDDVQQLGRLSPAVASGALILLFGSHLAQNESMLAPLRVPLPRLGFWELFLVRTGGLVAGSAVPVAGGLAVRLAYLRRLGLAYADFAHATLLSNVLALVAGAVVALPATAALWAVAGEPPRAAIALSAAVIATGVGAVLAMRALPRLGRHRLFPRWLPAIDAGSASREVVGQVFVASVVRHACSFVAFGWLYSALSPRPGGFIAGGLVYALTTPVRMLPLTPGNIGVNEWAVAVVGRALAFDVTTGLLVGGVFRAASMLAQGLGVLVGWAVSGPLRKP